MHTPDRRIAAIAARQRGVVSRAQALGAGLTRRAIDHRLAHGRLHPVFRGVYAVGHPALAPLGLETAALLATGEGSVLSHRSAAAIWRIAAAGDAAVDVLRPRPDAGRRPGVRLHLVDRLDPRDVRRQHGLRVTTPLRTLLDLAATGTPQTVARAFDEAQALRLVTAAQLRAAAGAAAGRRGIATLRALLDAPSRITRSEAERRLLDLLAEAGIPPPQTNARVLAYEVDLLWQGERLVIEVDGYAAHGSRTAFERDRLRDAHLQAAGFRVMRVTWRQITGGPLPLVARVAQALIQP